MDELKKSSKVNDNKNQVLSKVKQKLKKDTEQELERINKQLKESVDKLKREQDKNEISMK